MSNGAIILRLLEQIGRRAYEYVWMHEGNASANDFEQHGFIRSPMFSLHKAVLSTLSFVVVRIFSYVCRLRKRLEEAICPERHQEDEALTRAQKWKRSLDWDSRTLAAIGKTLMSSTGSENPGIARIGPAKKNLARGIPIGSARAATITALPSRYLRFGRPRP